MSELVQMINSSKKAEYLTGFTRLLSDVISEDMGIKKQNNGINAYYNNAEVGEALAKTIRTLSGSPEGFYPLVIIERMLISNEDYSNILYSALADRGAYLQMLQKGCNNEFGAELIRLLTLFILFSTGSESLENSMHNFTVSALKPAKSQGKKSGKNSAKRTSQTTQTDNSDLPKARMSGVDIINRYIALSSTNFLAILLDSVFDAEITSPMRCTQALESLNVLYTSVLSNFFLKNKIEEVLKLDRTSVYTDEEKLETRRNVGDAVLGCPGIVALVPEFRERILKWSKHAASTKDWNLALQIIQYLKICIIDISTVLVFVQQAEENPDDSEDESVKVFKLVCEWLNIPQELDPGLLEDEICSFVESILNIFPNTINTMGIPKKAMNNYISAVSEFEYFAKVTLGEEPCDINAAEEKYDTVDEDEDTMSVSSSASTTSAKSKLSEMDIENVMTTVASEFSNVNDTLDRARYREGLSFQNNNVLKKAVVELTLRVISDKVRTSGTITSVFTTRTSIIRYKFLLGVYNSALKLPYIDSESAETAFLSGLPGSVGNNEAVAQFLGLTYENVYSTSAAELRNKRNEKDKRITKDRSKPTVYEENSD